MKRRTSLLAIVIVFMLAACARPVIRKDLLQTGTRNVNLAKLASHPDTYKGRLFILGGIIVNSVVTDEGTVIEAIYVPVNKKGKLEESSEGGRYIAIQPKAKGILDPMIYRRNRMITVAGTFTGVRQGTLDKTAYAFPVFNIRQIHLWKMREYYPNYYYAPYYSPYYPYYYPYFYPYYGFGFGFGPFDGEEEEENEGINPGFRQPGAVRPGTPSAPTAPSRGAPSVR